MNQNTCRTSSIPEAMSIDLSASESASSFLSPSNHEKSILKLFQLSISEIQTPSIAMDSASAITSAAPSTTITPRSFILNLDIRQRQQREETERGSAQIMDQALQLLGLGNDSVMMLPMDYPNIPTKEPITLKLRSTAASHSTTSATTTTRNAWTPRRLLHSNRSETILPTLSDSSRRLLQLPLDTIMDISEVECPRQTHERSRITLRPKRLVDPPPPAPERLSLTHLILPATDMTSGPMLPITMTPEYSKPTLSFFDDLAGFQTPPPLSLRRKE